MTSPKVQQVALDDITLDPKLQMRVGMNDDAVADYAENLDALPPVKLKLDEDGKYWPWDGWHHMAAARLKGRKKVRCLVSAGEWIDAFLAAASANAENGMRRTSADKRRTVESLLRENEENNRGWTQRQMADIAKVSQTFISKVMNHDTDPATRVGLTKCDICGVLAGGTHKFGCPRILHPLPEANAQAETLITVIKPAPVPTPQVETKPQPQLDLTKGVPRCEECQIRPVTGCVACRRLRLAAPTNYSTAAPARPARTVPEPEPMEPRKLYDFDWTSLWEEVEAVERSIERIGQVCPGEGESAEYRRAKYMAESFRVLMRGWQERIVGKKK